MTPELEIDNARNAEDFGLCDGDWPGPGGILQSGRPEEAAKANGGIKELQQKRLAGLEQLCDVANKLFTRRANIVHGSLGNKRELFAAASSMPRRRTIESRRVTSDSECTRVPGDCKARKQAARGSHLDVLRAEDLELEAQIAAGEVAAGK